MLPGLLAEHDGAASAASSEVVVVVNHCEQPPEVPWRPEHRGKVEDLKVAKKKAEHVYVRFLGISEDGRIRTNDIVIDPAEESLACGVGSMPISKTQFEQFRMIGYFVAAHLSEGWLPPSKARMKRAVKAYADGDEVESDGDGDSKDNGKKKSKRKGKGKGKADKFNE